MTRRTPVHRLASTGIFVGAVLATLSAAVLLIDYLGRYGLWGHPFLLAFGLFGLITAGGLILAGSLARSGRGWALLMAAVGLIALAALYLTYPMSIVDWASRLW